MTVETKNEVKQRVTLIIEDDAYVAMMKYAHMFSPNECGGTGLVDRVDYQDGSTEFTVSKVYLPNQVNTTVTTDIDDDEMAKLNGQIVEDGDDPSLHKFHWHSHVDMAVFHSGTDDENYDEMKTGDYAISLVVNKKFEMLGSVHLYNPLRIDLLDIEIEPPDIDLKTYEVPEELGDVLQANVDKVHEYQASKITRPLMTTQYGRTYRDEYEGYDNLTNQKGKGLCNEPILLSLLHAGEKEGLIWLDLDSGGDVVGYGTYDNFLYFSIDSEPEDAYTQGGIQTYG